MDLPHTGEVTVITATRGRPELLPRALASVAGQCCAHVARHLILVDDCAETMAALDGIGPGSVRPVLVPRTRGQVSGVYRMAELRDIGAELAGTPWLAYLDDDNEWAPTHLHDLLELAAETGAPAVHSWREVTYADGTPYLRPVFPWARDEEAGRAEYDKRVLAGAIEPGSHVYRDGMRTEVDGGEWLLSVDLVRRLRFECVLEGDEWADRVGEDDKFQAKLASGGVRVACTRRPTLLYRLGGASNFGYRGSLTAKGNAGAE
jgi:glycosyltransferase involved in cell wall biosynthesis